MTLKKHLNQDPDSPSGEERQPRRDDSARNTETSSSYRDFARDKRERDFQGGQERRPHRNGGESDGRRDYSNRDYRNDSRDNHYNRERNGDDGHNGESYRRRSYNPNFTSDNRLRKDSEDGSGRDRRNYGSQERSGNSYRDNGNRSTNRYNNTSTYGERHQGGGYNRNDNRQDNREHRYGERREDYRHAETDGYRQSDRRPEYSRNDNREHRMENRSDGRNYRQGNDNNRDGYNREGGYSRGNNDRREGSFDRNRSGNNNTGRSYGSGQYNNKGGRGASDGRNKFGRQNKRGADRDSYPTFTSRDGEISMRLNRYIAMSGICSRREADDYIRSGVVSINDAVITEMGTKVNPGDVVKFNNEVIRNENKVYIVMNKPKGFVTSLDDPHAEKTVMDLMKNACRERIYPVGRLDKNSLGVLLVTNDGELTKRLTHPSYEKKKVYQVTLDKPLTRADMDKIVEGLELEDGLIYADAVSYIGDSKSEIGIEIHSGRNRIVRRIFEHLGYHVNKLDRVYFAGLTKKNLKRGEWRFLTRQEVETLRSGMYE